ncbi:hypothetical protein LTR53_006267 [Teratosphaeriaceae sp. CCFEE 6253]|nr:hypothetical protein LTR53_006267 [Teratosphaeriaceae sp. CCFEE 6253]
MARPNPTSTGQPQTPISFKTVPGRNKTQKWQQAKTYNYDGDDWGGYDPYDDYDDEPQSAHPPAASATQQQQPQYQQQYQQPQPQQRGPAPGGAMGKSGPGRQNSFDTGDDGRAFGGHAQQDFPDELRGTGPYPRSAGGNGGPPPPPSTGGSDYDRRARNFTNPEQVPPPLNTHSNANSPRAGPQQLPSAASGAFPPRKSSVASSSGHSASPALEPVRPPSSGSGPAAAKSLDKPLPFIRPSDIYRRMAEERERESRESLDTGRPSMDSAQRGAVSPIAAAGQRGSMDSPASLSAQDRRPSLPPVSEAPLADTARPHSQGVDVAAPESPVKDIQQEPTYQPLSSLPSHRSDFGEPAADLHGKRLSPVLPPVTRFSGFGSDFIHSAAANNRHSSEGSSPIAASQYAQSTLARVFRAPIMPASSDHGPAAPTPPYQSSAAAQTDLQHQPSTASTGFRSVVHRAFDQPPPSETSSDLSRDNSPSHSQSVDAGNAAGVSRSDTTSTAGISPIMSRVPSAAPHRQVDPDVPTPIHEEDGSSVMSTPTQSRHTSANYIPRKPSPGHGHSRNVSAETAGSGSGGVVPAGYRRSLDPPSNASSPARTPGVEDAKAGRRVSAPLSADVLGRAESPDVLDQAAEVPEAHLHPAETPAEERDEAFGSESPAPAPEAYEQQQRERTLSHPIVAAAQTGDYTAREADLARAAQASTPSSPAKPVYSPVLAEAEAASQQLFLRTHTGTSPSSPTSPGLGRPVSPGLTPQGLGMGLPRTGSGLGMNSTGTGTGTGRESPATVGKGRGRVREIADKYHSLEDASRRNSGASVMSSKSSWSRFGGSEENLGLPRRKGTGGSGGLLRGDSSPEEAGEGEGGWTPAGAAASLAPPPLMGGALPGIGGPSARAPGERGSDGDAWTPQGAAASLAPPPLVGGALPGIGAPSARAPGERSGDAWTPQSAAASLAPPPLVGGALHGIGGPSARAGTPQNASVGSRPAAASQMSFRPHLPGEWVSYARTPASEHAPALHDESPLEDASQHDRAMSSSPLTPRASQIAAEEDDEPVDLTPTRRDARGPSREYKPLPYDPPSRTSTASRPDSDDEPVDLSPNTTKTRLQDHDPDDALSSSLAKQVKDIGSALGASLMSIGGLESKARDFGSAAPAEPVRQPEMADKVGYGRVDSRSRPVMPREDSEMSVMTEAPVSVASEAPPSVPAKDSRPVSRGSRESWEEDDDGETDGVGAIGGGPRPASSYFSGAVPPLRTGHSRGVEREGSPARLRPTVQPMLSTDTGMEDTESDRLRKEIVRSLNPEKREQMKRESIMEHVADEEDAERTQDALDAPENARRIEQGERVLPPAEAKTEKPLPMMLDQRFSWENRPQAQRALTPPPAIREPEHIPEVLPEMPYERPHSRNLHLMNADVESSTDDDEAAAPAPALAGLAPVMSTGSSGHGLSPLVSPITRSQEDLGAGLDRRQEGPLRDMAPSPVEDESVRHESTSSASRFPNYPHSDFSSAAADLPTLGPTPAPREPADTSPVFPSTPTNKHASGGRVPPFREILAIKSSPQRIQAYDDTRQTFAELDTGLQGWLAGMVEKHPEHAHSLNASSATRPGAGLRVSSGTFKHRHSPSIIKFTKQFTNATGSAGAPPSDAAIRKASVGMGSGGGMADDAPKTAPAQRRTGGFAGETPIDVEKMQQKGKEIMKSVGGGAKGLFQRGKSRFGRSGDKAPAHSSSSSKPSSTSSTPPPRHQSRSPFPPPAASSASSLRFVIAGMPLASQVSTPSVTAPASRSQTPSGRPLSRTFARLRERRSRSTSTTGAKSRPDSLLITSPDLLLDSDDERDFRAAAGEDVLTPTGRAAGGRREVWDEDPRAAFERDEPGIQVRGDETPVRLGVLPSPGRESFSSFPGESPTKRLGSVDETLGKLAKEAGDNRGPSVAAVAAPAVPLAHLDTASPHERPQQQRQVSALASLPSQQRTRELNSPRSPAVAAVPAQPGEEDADDELYARTPVASTARRPWSDEQEVAGSITPREPVAPERIHDLKDDDQRSEVSAQEGHDVDEHHKVSEDFGEVESRRSSISSLGSPDTIVARRVSRILRERDQGGDATERPFLAGDGVSGLSTGPTAVRYGRTGTPHGAVEMVDQLPPLPLGTTLTDLDSQTFMNRPYHGRVTTPGRVMSYMPLGNDEQGVPVQEALDTENGEPSPSVDLSGFSGPPTGTPPFQQHPLLRNSGYVQPSEYDKLRSSPIGTVVSSTQHSRQVSADASRRSSRRFSGFFRGPDVPPDTPPVADMPPPHAVPPSYGPRDLNTTGVEAVADESADKPDKRRSGVWESFRRAPSTPAGVEPSPAPVGSIPTAASSPYPINKPLEDASKPRTLKKQPQRAASAATPPTAPPEKKKRFSGFGSLFGRSSTQGRSTPKPNKLTKTQPPPPSRDSSTIQSAAPRTTPYGYDAFETTRRQQIPDLQQQPTAQPAYIDPDAPFASVPRGLPPSSRPATRPPSQGWTSPIEYTSPVGSSPRSPQPMPVQRPDSRPQYRSLHSSTYQRGIPEAFRPVEASYGRQVAPIGPPALHQGPVLYRPVSSQQHPTLPTQQAYWSTGPPPSSERFAEDAAAQRPSTAGPLGYSPPPPGSAVLDAHRPSLTVDSSFPSSSPAPTMMTPQYTPPPRERRVGSLGQEMARNPAQQYADQAPRWGRGVPDHERDIQRDPHISSWTGPAPYSQHYNLPRGLPMSPESPHSSSPNYHQHQNPAQSQSQAQKAAMYPDLYARDASTAGGSRYPSPPYTPQSPAQQEEAGRGKPAAAPYHQNSYEEHYAGQGQYQGHSAGYGGGSHHDFYAPQTPSQRQQQQQQSPQRYYAPQPPPPPQLQYYDPEDPYTHARPLTYQRTPSGFTGRRDDAAVGEQGLMGLGSGMHRGTGMRGASYPGQEWSP